MTSAARASRQLSGPDPRARDPLQKPKNVQNPNDTTAASADLDTLLQRIRGTVQARGEQTPALESDGSAFEDLESALREQARLTESALSSVEEIGTQLRELQEQVASTDERRSRQTEYVTRQVREI